MSSCWIGLWVPDHWDLSGCWLQWLTDLLPPSRLPATRKRDEQLFGLGAGCQFIAPLLQMYFHCLLCNNGAEPCKYFPSATRYNVKLCQENALEGTLEEGGVCLPSTSMLLSACLCTQLLQRVRSAAQGTSRRAHIPLTSLTEQSCGCSTSQRMA